MKTFYKYEIVNNLFKLLIKIGLPLHHFYYSKLHKINKEEIINLIPQTLSIKSKANLNEWKNISSKAPIYFLWFQGITQMPPVVSLCYNQLLKYKGQHPVILITEDNISNYIPIPSFDFLKLYKNNIISIQHFSDLLRTYILSINEGIWIDATCFINKPIDDIILTKEFYSIKRKYNKNKIKNPVEGRFSSYFMSVGKNNDIPLFLFSGLQEIITNYGSIPYYFTLDYLFSIYYEKNMKIKEYIDKIPNILPYYFSFINVDDVISENYFNSIIKKCNIFKLNWRSKGLKYYKNKKTIFFYLNNLK